MYAVALPLGLILLWAAILQPGFHKAHVTVLGLAISVMLATFLTDVVKNSVGRPRPDLIARCKPKKGTPVHELVTIEVCTQTDHHVLRKSIENPLTIMCYLLDAYLVRVRILECDSLRINQGNHTDFAIRHR